MEKLDQFHFGCPHKTLVTDSSSSVSGQTAVKTHLHAIARIIVYFSSASSLLPELRYLRQISAAQVWLSLIRFQVERDCGREEKDDFDSDREDSVTLSEHVMSSPCAQHNGSYKTHNAEDASVGADGTKWLSQHCGN